MDTMASQITSLTIVYSAVYSGADQRKHQSSASLAFVWGIHRSPVNSPHKWPVMRKMFPFDDVIMSKTKRLRSILWKLQSGYKSVQRRTDGQGETNILTNNYVLLGGVITFPFPNIDGATIEVWNWISYFITHFTGHVITYPSWD